MSSIDKELARDITVAWINCGKVSEEYLTKKQVAAFYECMFLSISECKIQQKSMQIETTAGTTTITAGAPPRRTEIPSAAASTVSKHRFNT